MKNHLRYFQSMYWLCLLFVIALNGCATSETPVPSLTDTSPPPTDTSIPTRTSSPTITLSPTITVSPTKTRRPTLTPTWTPWPTLPADEALEVILALYENNGGCELPCWWGVTPGETLWKDVYARFAPFSHIGAARPLEEGVVRYEIEIEVPEELSPIEYFFPIMYVDHGIVVDISLNTRYVMRSFDYSLAGLLGRFGLPEEIWLKFVSGYGDEGYYYINLFYPQQGIFIGSNGTRERVGDSLVVCPQILFTRSVFAPTLYLWSPTKQREYTKEYFPSFYSEYFDTYYLLEDYTTNIDTQTFYETYLDPNTEACFEIDITDLPWNR